MKTNNSDIWGFFILIMLILCLIYYKLNFIFMEDKQSKQIKKLLEQFGKFKVEDDLDLSEFEEIDTSRKSALGEGYFGRVVAWDKDSVMKIIRTDRMSINDRKKQLMEIKLHQKLDHPNITKCIGTYIN